MEIIVESVVPVWNSVVRFPSAQRADNVEVHCLLANS